MKRYSLLIFYTLCFYALCGYFNFVYAFDVLPKETSGLSFVQTLNSDSQAFQLAKAIFLPNVEDDSFSGNKLQGDYNTDRCAEYPLQSCPQNAICSRCPFNHLRYRVDACKNGYKYSNKSCVPENCAAMGYVSTPQIDQICTKVTNNGLTCYKDCRMISCSAYSVSCSKLPPFATAVTKCPDCLKEGAKCSDYNCKISQCAPGYQIANGGTSCIPLDDTCPAGFSKTCEDGIDDAIQPQLTQAGNKCYKCKPACEDKFKYDESNCLNGYVLSGNSCGGKYEQCIPPCDSSYIYDETNCPSSKFYHCSQSCGNKYSDCRPPLYSGDSVIKDNMTYVKIMQGNNYIMQNEAYCPAPIKKIAKNGSFIDFILFDGVGGQYAACVDADQTCYDLAQKIANSKTELNISLTSDIYCGNLTIENWKAPVIIDGQGHSITFDKPYGYDILARSGFIKIKNAKIISKSTYRNYHPIDAQAKLCSADSFFASRKAFFENTINIDNAYVMLDNVVVESEHAVGGAATQTKLDIKKLPSSEIYNDTGAYPVAFGTLNISGYETAYAVVHKDGIANIKADKAYLWFHDNGIVNVCAKFVTVNDCKNLNNAILNTPVEASVSSTCPNLKVNIVKDLCSSSEFTSNFE